MRNFIFFSTIAEPTHLFQGCCGVGHGGWGGWGHGWGGWGPWKHRKAARKHKKNH
ncbi:hypothetical protein ANCDUO_17824 [Ancylostoma duodenale]|uniref:Uncharacterized protein n=1 Tax=Ancylostoma duodenale TaxID=51022 RepID=A0A0C2FZH5_9BILA|nr:hypothetical protein ANCDUO_17824 [Ancylostoma duodenale]